MPPTFFRVGRAHTGLGLFAIAPIKKDAVIIEYVGLRIPTPEAEARERRYGSKYMFKMNRRWSINGSSRSNLARYLNHSCRPNSKAFIERGRLIEPTSRSAYPFCHGDRAAVGWSRIHISRRRRMKISP
jgi:SET domain-containing protein